MSIQEQLISEILHQPEPLLREVWHYLNFLKTKSNEETSPSQSALRCGYGTVPGITLTDDFDAPLPDFSEYRPSKPCLTLTHSSGISQATSD